MECELAYRGLMEKGKNMNRITAFLLALLLISLLLLLSGANNGDRMEEVSAIDSQEEGDNLVYLAFFGNPGCQCCDEAWDMIVNELKPEYPNLVTKRFDFIERKNIELAEALYNHYDVPYKGRDAHHIIFIGENATWTKDVESSEKELRVLIEYYSNFGTSPPWKIPEEETEKEQLIERFTNFSVITVLSAGLIDGINPCAFGTAVLLVTFLASLGGRGKILLFGASYIIAVFLTYLVIGLGILTFIQRLAFFPLLAKGVHLSVAIIAGILGLLSIYDYIMLRKGKPKAVKLQLPDTLANKIYGVVEGRKRKGIGIFATFGVGVIIGLCTFICTGQIYLPTIAYMTGVPSLQAKAYLYLLYFNLMYILPLIAVFGIAAFGISSKKLADIGSKHVKKIKILTGGLLLIMAAVMFLVHI